MNCDALTFVYIGLLLWIVHNTSKDKFGSSISLTLMALCGISIIITIFT